MTLTKQERLRHYELEPFFRSVYETKVSRSGISAAAPAEDWSIEGYIDGPVTFIVLDNGTGQRYTGWSKFDNTGKYTETGGIYRAITKAVEKYLHAVADDMLSDLLDRLPPCGGVSSVDPFEDLHEKEDSLEFQIDEDAKRTG